MDNMDSTQTTEKSQDARAVANYILDIAFKYDVEHITLMQLLKLVFLSHGWSLALNDASLVAQAPQAWQYGPVYPEIYRALNKYGSNPIRERIMDKETNFPYSANLSERQKKVIEAVLKSYGKKHAFELSNITHLPDSPWDKTIKTTGVYTDIPFDRMKKYYNDLAQKRGIKEL